MISSMSIYFVVVANIIVSAIALVILPFMAVYIPLLAIARWKGHRLNRTKKILVTAWIGVLLVSYFDILVTEHSNIPIFGTSIRALQRRILDKVPMLGA